MISNRDSLSRWTGACQPINSPVERQRRCAGNSGYRMAFAALDARLDAAQATLKSDNERNS